MSDSHITGHSLSVRQWDLAASRQGAGDSPIAEAGVGELSISAEGRPGETSNAAAACQHIPLLTLPPADADSTAVTVMPANKSERDFLHRCVPLLIKVKHKVSM